MRFFCRLLLAASFLLGADSITLAGTVTGQFQLPSSGQGIRNSTITFTLTQAAVVSGSAAIVASPWACWTESSGNIVGLPGDAAITAPVLSSTPGSGALPGGTYYVKYTWKNSTGESQPSAERSLVLSSSGTLVVRAPVSVPAAAVSMQLYIGNSSGAETLQGSVAVTNGVIAGNYSQSAALVSGAALPSSNTSACQLRFNDELQPSYTGYNVNLINTAGATMPGFPQKWYLSGGASGTVNVSSGTPLYSGVVVYPQAVVTMPAASSQQSINGPLNLNGFGLTAGSGTIQSSGAFNNTGTFTTGLQNEYLTSLLNSISPVTEFQAVQANTSNFATEAIAGGAAVPSDSTMTQVNGVAGYVSHAGTSSTNAVGVYGQCRFLAANGHCWGGNLVFSDKGFVGTGTAAEDDCNVTNTSTTGACHQVNGSFTGNPPSFPAYQIAAPNGGGKWSSGYTTNTGATNIGVYLNPVASGVGQPSQQIQLSGSAGIAQLQASANGGLTITLPVNQSIIGPAGTATNPSVTFFGDAGTGIYSPAPGLFGIAVSGSATASSSSTGFRHVGSIDIGFFGDTFLNRQSATNFGLGSTTSGKDGTLHLRRVRTSGGTALTTGDFSSIAGTGWGSAASIAAVVGTDAAFQVTISSSGTGQSANPNLTLTFKDGTWVNSPIVSITRADLASPSTGYWIVNTVSATQLTMTFVGTPVTGNSYLINVICVGR